MEKGKRIPAGVSRKTCPRPQASSVEDLIGKSRRRRGEKPGNSDASASEKRVWTLGRDCREKGNAFRDSSQGEAGNTRSSFPIEKEWAWTEPKKRKRCKALMGFSPRPVLSSSPTITA